MKFNKYLKIGLSEKKHPVKNDTEINDDFKQLLDRANKELRKYYSGGYCFDICDEIEKSADDLKLSPKNKRAVKEIWLKFNSEVSKVQRQYECFLQKEIEK